MVEAFLKLDKRYQDAIAEVTMKMGYGMAEFITKEARSMPALARLLICFCRW